MRYDQGYYRDIWGRVLKKYGPNHPVEDLGDLSRAEILGRALAGWWRDPVPTMTVHDYGAGNWLYLETVMRVFSRSPGIQIHGFDYSGEALAYGIRRASLNGLSTQGIHFHEGEIASLLGAQAAGSVDVVISLETLEHLEHDVEAVQQFFRILSPGGRLVLSVPNRRPFPLSRGFFSYVFFKRTFTEKDMRVGHLRRYSIPDLRLLVERAGFCVEAAWPYGMLCSEYLKPIAAVGGLWARVAFRIVSMENRIGRKWGIGASEGFFLLCQKPKAAVSS